MGSAVVRALARQLCREFRRHRLRPVDRGYRARACRSGAACEIDQVWCGDGQTILDDAAMDGVPGLNTTGNPTSPGSCATDTPSQYFAARSKHRGGVNVSCCDASIHFVSDAVDLAIWRALSTAAGGENI